ncbi:MAG: hypothetical protein KIS92_03695 [Planctomycetota bacterium]|nr:hypothetical protein [Planctomycetota bacterium]
MRLAFPILVLAAALASSAWAEEYAGGPNPLELLPPPRTADGLPAAEVVDLAPPKAVTRETVRETKAPASERVKEPGLPPAAPPASGVPGYKGMLCGELTQDIVVDAEHSPVLVRGVCVVPAGRTLTLKPGAVLELQPDPHADAPEKPGQPDPTKAGQLWIVGKFAAEGRPGRAAQVRGTKAAAGAQNGIFFYGSEPSDLTYLNLTDVAVTQCGPGAVLWSACAFEGSKHYALASGAVAFLQCSFRRCGGLFAAYPNGVWALMAMRCEFQSCREGLVIGSDPGDECIVFRANALLDTSGANLRAEPAGEPRRDANGKPRRAELLIGENWYGNVPPEVVDAKIVDVRTNPRIPMRLNTRPPAAAPYENLGAHAPPEALAKALKELEPVRARFLAAYEKKRAPKAAPVKP